MVIVSDTAHAQTFQFKELKTDSVQKHYKRILLIGHGSVETRVFLESLSSKIIEELKTDSMVIEYQFLGKTTKQTPKQVENLLNSSYDAYMIFSPTDTSDFSIQSGTYYNSVNSTGFGPVNYSGRYSSINYAQNFKIESFEPGLKTSPTWAAKLYVDGDFSKKRMYSRISKKIIASLKESKLLK